VSEGQRTISFRALAVASHMAAVRHTITLPGGFRSVA